MFYQRDIKITLSLSLCGNAGFDSAISFGLIGFGLRRILEMDETNIINTNTKVKGS